MATISTKSSTPVQTSGTSTGGYGPALAVLTTLFFIWGSLTSLNDVLIPFAQHVFNLGLGIHDGTRTGLTGCVGLSAAFLSRTEQTD